MLALVAALRARDARLGLWESSEMVALPAKIAETLYPLEISVEGGEVSGR